MDLQAIWFVLVGVLIIGYAILDGFDLGVGMLHLFITRNDDEKRQTINAIAPFWDGNEVWLLTAGGAIFAAFPPVYATVFSGFYLALILLLVALILRAVSLEFRGKVEVPGWRKVWDSAFALGSFLPALLFGVAIGNVVRGVPIGADGEFAGTFLGLLNPFAIVVGLTSVVMFVCEGAAWLYLKTEGVLQARAANVGFAASLVFLVLWAAMTLLSRTEAPRLWRVYSHPAAWLLAIVFLFAAFSSPVAFRAGGRVAPFVVSSIATASLIGIMGQGLYPYMVPAVNDAASLTIRNASSSTLTLRVMLAIALIGMPVVIGYTIFIYRKFRGAVVLDDHSY